MTNSEVLQYIIQQLHESPLKWKGNKELFELIFAPLTYGNDVYQKRKIIKDHILKNFKNSKNFNKKKFQILIDDNICNEDRSEYVEKVIEFINSEMIRLDVTLNVNIKKVINEIPCNEMNYKNNFSNWKTKPMKIMRLECRRALEKNFDFSQTLWTRGDIFIKNRLKSNIENFIIQRTKIVINIFEEMRKEFDMKNNITQEEIQDLQLIQNMSQIEFMEYINKYYPLNKNRSQEFIRKLIPILYSKGYYQLLLHDVMDELDMHLRDTNQIKKIKAHLLGSSVIGEYKQAFNLLSTISSDDDSEIVDMRTEAISNMRRYQLTNTNTNQKIEIIQKLISYYKEIFEHNQTYHYYPAINLIYMMKLFSIIDENQLQLNNQIDTIYKKSKKSISIDKSSQKTINQYYANMAEIEFLILRNIGDPIAELEMYLEISSNDIPLIELDRTVRQMQFFDDNLKNLKKENNFITTKVENFIKVINDFIDLNSQS